MPLLDLAQSWFTAYTVPRHEKRIAEHFQQRQIEYFLPLYTSRRHWKDGSRTYLDLPLFLESPHAVLVSGGGAADHDQQQGDQERNASRRSGASATH